MTDDGFTILAVCQGNVHRSALADVLLRRWAEWYLPGPIAAHVTVGSAGIGAPVGHPMEDPVREIAAALGADAASHRARQISDALIDDADLVLTATRRQRDQVLQRVPGTLRRVFTIREAGRIAETLGRSSDFGIDAMRRSVARFATLRGDASAVSDDDIADPQGRGDAAFAKMVRREVPPLAHIAVLLFGMPRGDLEAYIHAATESDLRQEPST